MMKKVKAVLITLFCLAASAALAGSICIGYQTYRAVKKQNALLQAQLDIAAKEEEKQDANRENDVKIGGQYEILDTSAISDAYLTGDTSALTDEKDLKTYELASALIQEIIEDGMSEYEKELAIYQWITQNIKFEGGSLVAIPNVSRYCDRPYGVLQSKQAVCVGYATTFRLLCNMVGIECHVMHDTSLSHSWDRVKIEGEWYNVDCTFDAGSGPLKYRNFNMCDAAFSQSHDWSMTIFPEANGVKYSYAYQNAVDMKDIYAIPKDMKQRLDKKESMVYYKLPVEQADDLSDMLSEIQNRMYTMYPDGYMEYNYYPIDGKVFIVGIGLPQQTSAAAEGNENYQKIIDAINEAFGEQEGMY